MTNAEKLKKLMRRHKMSINDVAEKLGSTRFSVIAWLRPEDNVSYRNMPDTKLRLLELLIADEQSKNKEKR